VRRWSLTTGDEDPGFSPGSSPGLVGMTAWSTERLVLIVLAVEDNVHVLDPSGGGTNPDLHTANLNGMPVDLEWSPSGGFLRVGYDVLSTVTWATTTWRRDAAIGTPEVGQQALGFDADDTMLVLARGEVVRFAPTTGASTPTALRIPFPVSTGAPVGNTGSFATASGVRVDLWNVSEDVAGLY